MRLFHKTKNQKENSDQLLRLMIPTIAGMLACVFCLVSMTWAWFSASVDTPMQTMQSASRSTAVAVYEVSAPEAGKRNVKKTLVEPQMEEAVSLAEEAQTTDADMSMVMAGEPVVWELSPEKSYEVVMTGSGTASTGYCQIALSHTASGSDTAETKLYKTAAFEKDGTFTFTYNTGGFAEIEGVTATEWEEYVEKTTPPTLEIASHWGTPAEEETTKVSRMSARNVEEEILLLSDGDVVGLAPIPCPEAKAEIAITLEGFAMQSGGVISAEEDYTILLALQEGHEMPGEVKVNIDGKDYVVSTGGTEARDDAPYYDAEAGILTIPSALLTDGTIVSVRAIAPPIPAEEPEEEPTEEETEETTDTNETEEEPPLDTPADNEVVAEDPSKKEEDGEQNSGKPVIPSVGDGGDDDDEDEEDTNAGGPSDGDDFSSENEEETEDEKADVKLNLSQFTINLEETKIPTNADLVLTLSAKEDMELPEEIVITLDKTIRDEEAEEEEIEEDKTEYTIYTDGEDNPEGFEFDAESGKLIISSELLRGVREITIADTVRSEEDAEDEKATIAFEVTNLTFDFTDDEIVTDEDVVITFTAGEGYELPETIVITIDGEKYTVYTSEEDSEKTPEGITFDPETGTLTISKDLLENAEAITIAAEGIKKEDEDSENEDTPDKGNDGEGGDGTEPDPEGGIDTPATQDKTENEGETGTPGGENGETTSPETNPDNTTEGEDTGKTETPEPDTEPSTPTEPDAGDNTDGEQGTEGEDTGKTETPDPDTEPSAPTEPDAGDNADGEQGTEGGETGENGEDKTGNETGKTTEPTPGTESDDGGETPATEPDAPATAPETTGASAPATGGNDGEDKNGTESAESSSAENNNQSCEMKADGKQETWISPKENSEE